MQKSEESEIFEYRPAIFSCSDSSELAAFHQIISKKNPVLLDTLDNQISDLLPCLYPAEFFAKTAPSVLQDRWLNGRGKNTIGNWVYFPWKNTAVKLLGKDDFIICRTNRNLLKITEANHKLLQQKKVLFVGLSVGQSAALTFAMQRIGGVFYLADFDHLSLSNMNRIRASVLDIQLPKTIIAARAIAELDPYLEIHCVQEGVTHENIQGLLTENGNIRVDLIVEECDSLDIKFKIREFAKDLHIPVIMETSDRGMLDVERFDQEPSRPVFHGLTNNISSADVKQMDTMAKFAVLQKLVDITQISDSLKMSYAAMGKELISWPQLAAEVMLGGASLAMSAEKILSGKPLKSGRYYIDLDHILNN